MIQDCCQRFKLNGKIPTRSLCEAACNGLGGAQSYTEIKQLSQLTKMPEIQFLCTVDFYSIEKKI